MVESSHRCIKNVDGLNQVKNGKTKEGKQRFKCRGCKRTFINNYSYNACHPSISKRIKKQLVEGSGIRSTARILKIHPVTVVNRILKLAGNVKRPAILKGKKYELDEMCTFIGNKESRIWIAYALRKGTNEVVAFNVGKRTKKTLRVVSDTLLLSEAVKVYTDKLKQYKSLIPKAIHSTSQYGTNHIERMNTTLRCHLKRLNRKTIAYSKSLAMLNACLTIYFWG